MLRRKPLASHIASTNIEHFHLLEANIRRGAYAIDIASFRIGGNTHLCDMLCALPKQKGHPRVRLLIGLNGESAGSPYQEYGFQDPCEGVIEEVVEKAASKKFSARTLRESHFKCWIFHRRNPLQSTAIVGGRNLNFSDWLDVSIELGAKHAKHLTPIFDAAWYRASRVSPSSTRASIAASPSFVTGILNSKHKVE